MKKINFIKIFRGGTQKAMPKLVSGFTLVEALVAIGILSLSVMAASMAVQSSLSSSYYARDQVTAFYLIQDAVEYVRNLRDINALRNAKVIAAGPGTVDWLNGISQVPADPCYFGKFCMVSPAEISPNNLVTCGDGSSSSLCSPIRQDNATGKFGYLNSNWPQTKFTRFMQISQSSTTEIILTITVTWKDNAIGNTSVSVQEWLRNTR